MPLILLLFFVTWLLSMCFVVIGAENRGRSVVGWLVFAFFFSPWFAGFGLLMLGEPKA